MAKKVFKTIGVILIIILIFLVFSFIYHKICNKIESKKIECPTDKIEVYNNEYISAIKMGEGKYTVVFLPGMGTSSPYYDYYNLASLVKKYASVLIVEPLGYGFSDDTDKERNLNNYEYELNKVLDYYNIKENIILLGHSYSGIQNLNYANKHSEVKALICLDCTTAYQIESHVKNNEFTSTPPVYSKSLTLFSKLGITRLFYSTVMKSSVQKDLLKDVKEEYWDSYKHLLYNKTMNKTIVNELNSIPYNQLELLYQKYNENLYTLTFLSDESTKEMKEYKEEGDFLKDWEEMHNALISNSNIQHIYTLKGSHYIHHNNTEEISNKIYQMINELN